MPASSRAERQVLWRRDADPRFDHAWPALAAERSVQVAVIGGGFTGLSAALKLAEGGVEVALLEADRPGVGASGRCAGFLVPNLARADPDALRATYGAAIGERLARRIGAAPAELSAAAERLGVGGAVRRCGWLQPVVGAAALAPARARFEQWRALDQPVEWLDAAAAERATALTGLAGAWLDRAGGVLQPVDYLNGLARGIGAAGGALYAGSPVTELRPTGCRWRLVTPRAALTAERVLVCTNGGGFPGLEALGRAVLPVTVTQVASRPLAAELRAGLAARPVSDTRRNIFTYRFDRAGRLITGGMSLAGARTGLRRFGAALLHRARRELRLPAAALSVDTVWQGRIAVTPDYLPRLYRPAPGLWAGVGCNGRGIAMTWVLGGMLAAAARGDDPLLPVSPLRPWPWRHAASLSLPCALLLGRLRDRLQASPPAGL